MPNQMKRDDYRAVKRMNREQMSAYLTRIYERGYMAAMKQMNEKATGAAVEHEAAVVEDLDPADKPTD